MANTSLKNQISTLLDQARMREGGLSHAPSGMHFLRHSTVTIQDSTIYSPLLCLVLQGAKEVGTSGRTLTVADGQLLLVSHTLPVTSRITVAASDRPYIALVFPLDLDVLRSLAADVPLKSGKSSHDRFSISLCQTDPELEDAISRYLQQTKNDQTHRLLARITHREIHARLLMGPHGEQLRKLLWHETMASRISQA
ncbi:MAG: AraC family transcriptional regulator, partial [Pseudomonadota bacterium]